MVGEEACAQAQAQAQAQARRFAYGLDRAHAGCVGAAEFAVDPREVGGGSGEQAGVDETVQTDLVTDLESVFGETAGQGAQGSDRVGIAAQRGEFPEPQSLERSVGIVRHAAGRGTFVQAAAYGRGAAGTGRGVTLRRGGDLGAVAETVPRDELQVGNAGEGDERGRGLLGQADPAVAGAGGRDGAGHLLPEGVQPLGPPGFGAVVGKSMRMGSSGAALVRRAGVSGEGEALLDGPGPVEQATASRHVAAAAAVRATSRRGFAGRIIGSLLPPRCRGCRRPATAPPARRRTGVSG
ncbi:hypothetical protein [Streptomyces chromofuscus]|uniref:hypothetical protein n=1 Tax=Streptomyces chromofuscus TaxID=42881 RepID=UPI00167BCA09|nr:hypothetical protein [Streptomyces chromofuscus]GGT02763.1 hypothetical protein GCM10010254_23850 [Streptomyces chromofuscus]